MMDEKKSPVVKYLNRQARVQREVSGDRSKRVRTDHNLTSYRKGKWRVDPTDRTKFYREYLRSLEDGYELALIERKGDINPFVVDFDLDKLQADAVEIEGEQWSMRRLVENLLRSVQFLCDEHLGTQLGDGLEKWSLATREGSHNVHAILQQVRVSNQQSDDIIGELQDEMHTMRPDLPWKDAIDKTSKGGLRMMGSVNDKGNGVYLPVDIDWEPIELTIETLSAHSLIPDGRPILTKKEWQGIGNKQRADNGAMDFDLPRVEGIDWVQHATSIATQFVKEPHWDRPSDGHCTNRFTFSSRNRRRCPHDPEGHVSNRFSLIYTEGGSVVMRCLQQDCRRKGAVKVADWPKPCMFIRPNGRICTPATPSEFDEQYLEELSAPWEQALRDKDPVMAAIHADKCFDYMNQYLVHVLSPPGCIISYKRKGNGHLKEMQRYSMTAYSQNYRALIMSKWLSSAKRSRVDADVWDPKRTDNPKHFNTFTGHIVEDAVQGLTFDPSKIKLIRDQLLTASICDGDEASAAYIEKLVAMALRGHKTGVVIVLQGTNGVGKSMYLDKLVAQRLFGLQRPGHQGSAFVMSRKEELTGKFNAHNSNKCWLVVDDCDRLRRDEMQPLKALVTQPTENVQRKGVDISNNGESHTNVAISTNWDNCTPGGPNERRFFTRVASNTWSRDHSYWKPIDDSLDEGAKHYYLYLMSIDLTGFDPQNDMPVNAEDVERRRDAMSAVGQFILSRLDDDRILVAGVDDIKPHDVFYPEEGKGVVKERLYRGYQLWYKSWFPEAFNGHKMGQKWFSKELSRVCGITRKTYRKEGGVEDMYVWITKEQLLHNMRQARELV